MAALKDGGTFAPSVEPLHWLSATELLTAYRRGETDPVAVTSALLTRIERLNPTLSAFESVFAEPALVAARVSAERWARVVQSDDSGVRPLEGVPVAIKDLLTTVEGPTSVGTDFLAGYLSRKDAAVVRRLRDAGAIILGKTAMTEGAFAQHHPARITPVNPWAPDRSPGVSSSGSAVAVAAGLCPIALGTDTGGSIRFPCGNNRLVGLKPTVATFDEGGCFPLSSGLDHIGPIVRSVQDLEVAMLAMGWNPKPVSVTSGRVAVDRKQLSQRCDPKIRSLLEVNLEGLERLGYQLVDYDLEAVQWPLAMGWLDRVGVSALREHQKFHMRHAKQYGPAFSWLLEHGERVTTDRLRELEQMSAAWSRELDHLLSGVDALVCPVSAYPNPPLGNSGAPPSPEAIANSVYYTAPFNFSGHPALTLPMGFVDGAPSGFQLIGQSHNEAGLIALGQRIQEAQPWSDHPTEFE